MSRLIKAIDQLILNSRLEDLRLLALTPYEERAMKLAAALSQLDAGYYLLGCGPYNTGLIKIGTTDIVLGRQSSPLEELSENVVDFLVNDAVLLTPREVSRNHATIHLSEEDGRIYLQDNGSTTGTWLNDEQLDSAGIAVEVELGSAITLGASGINTYLCFEVGEDQEEGDGNEHGE